MKARMMGIAGLLISVSALAALKAPDFAVQATPANGKVTLQATAPAKHHFNTEAPMSAELSSTHERLAPKKSGPAKIEFEVPSSSKDSAKVALFLCDDAKTFCEKHLVSVAWEGQPGASAGTPKSVATGAEKNPAPRTALDSHGFYDNLPEEAFAQARSTGKPLLIDFYGIWCPPCNELNDQVFSKIAFKKSSTSFVKLKIDADTPSSEGLAQRYGIQGFPTVVFASPEGDEIGRVVGYRPIREFLSAMKGALGNRTKTFSALKAKAEAGDRAAADRIGLIYLDRAEYEQALRYLNDTKKEREKLHAAEIGLYASNAKAANESAKSKWIKALQTAIQEFPDSPDSIQRRDDLASALTSAKKADEARAAWQDLVAAAKRLLSKPEALKGYDISDGDLYVSIGEASAELGEKDQAESAWRSGAEVYRKKINAGAERGGTLELAYCLRKLGQTDEAAKLYQKMQKAYPDEFTFWLADAKMNMQLKKYDRARDLAQTAFGHSYGANKLDSAVVLANAWKELGQPLQGKKVIAEALESLPPLPPRTNQAARSRIRTRVESLNKLAAELGKAS